MTWSNTTEYSNTWNLIDYNNYVLEGYWVDGYIVESNQFWLDVIESDNTWEVIG